jgi:hypothetical protein
MSDHQQPEHEMDDLLRSVRIEPAADFDQHLHARLRQSVEQHTGEIAAARTNHRVRSTRQRTGLFVKDTVMKRTNWMLPVFAVLILGVLLIAFAVVILLPNINQQPAAGETETPQSTPEATSDALSATATVGDTAVPAVGSAADCPAAQSGQAQYINQTAGYCFLYPEGWEVTEGGVDVLLRGPFHDLDHTQEGETATLRVNAIAEAGMTSTEFSDMVMGWYPGLNVIRSNTEIGGIEAVMLEDLPSVGGRRMLIVFANSFIYSIEMGGTAGDVVQQDADQAWALLSDTVTFFTVPPLDVVSPQEACPQPTADTQLALDRMVGYCLLLPADAEQLPGAMIFYLGPDIPGMAEGFEPRSSIGIGPGGPLDGRAIADIARERGAASVTETTFAGHPAVIAESGPEMAVPNRIAYVVVGDQFYTVLVSPTDYALFPDAQQPVEQLWSLAQESLAFFTSWDMHQAP